MNNEDIMLEVVNRIVRLEQRINELEQTIEDNKNAELVTVTFTDNGAETKKFFVRGSLITPPSKGKWKAENGEYWNFTAYRVIKDLTLTKEG